MPCHWARRIQTPEPLTRELWQFFLMVCVSCILLFVCCYSVVCAHTGTVQYLLTMSQSYNLNPGYPERLPGEGIFTYTTRVGIPMMDTSRALFCHPPGQLDFHFTICNKNKVCVLQYVPVFLDFSCMTHQNSVLPCHRTTSNAVHINCTLTWRIPPLDVLSGVTAGGTRSHGRAAGFMVKTRTRGSLMKTLLMMS